MNDNALFRLIIATLGAGMTAAGSTIAIQQSYQPTQQGVKTAPCLYIHKVGDRRAGWPARTDVYDSDTDDMVHTEIEQYETTFQISSLATQNPADTSAKTASDWLNLAAYVLQSNNTVNTFEAQGVGIYSVKEVRNPYFVDDRDQNEASPNFDFTLTHKQIIVTRVPIVTKSVYQFYRV